MSLKLDMSKVYDRMEWIFLEAVLLGLGFDTRWVRTIMQCVSIVRYSFLKTGKPCGSLIPSKTFGKVILLHPIYSYCVRRCFLCFEMDQKVDDGLVQGVKFVRVLQLLVFSCLLIIAYYLVRLQFQSMLLFNLCYLNMEQLLVNKLISIRAILSLARLSIFSWGAWCGFVDKHKKYLGLATIVGRNRTNTFAYINYVAT